MMRPFALFMFVLVLVSFGHTHAQENDTEAIWYFAWNRETAQVVAYTLDGRISVAAENIDAPPSSVWRLNNKWAVVINSDNTLHLLTPTTLQQIATFDSEPAPFMYHPPYLIVVENADNYAPLGYLLNLETGEKMPLTGRLYDFFPHLQLRFSADSQKLRYWSQEDQFGDGWQLLERDLNAHTETLLFAATFGGAASRYGDFWGYGVRLGEEYGQRIFAVDPTEDVSPYEALIKDRLGTIINNDLIVFPVETCTQDCIVGLYPLGDGDVITATFSVMKSAFGFIRLDESQAVMRVLVNDGEVETWLVHSDGQKQLLGKTPIGVANSAVSADGHWVFGFNEDNTRYVLWNSQLGATVLEIEHDPAETPYIAATYAENGVAWFDRGGNPQLYYVDGMEGAIRLPEVEGGNFFGLAPYGDMFFVQRPPREGDPQGEQKPGIYVYDPVGEVFEVLVEQAVFPIYIRELGQ